MCARYTISISSLNKLLAQFACELSPLDEHRFDWKPRYNIKPGEREAQSLIVRPVDGRRQLSRVHWPLVPWWAKTRKVDFSTVNARAETVATKPAFRAAYKKRRCLVLADHYVEFERVGKEKLPWLYSVDDEQPFAIAGLWEVWRDPAQPEAEPYESCTLLVTSGNDLTMRIHDRMPVILDAADYDAWLRCEEIPLVSFPADRMAARRTSTYINNVRNEGPECLAPPH